jgi:hypothetical protein
MHVKRFVLISMAVAAISVPAATALAGDEHDDTPRLVDAVRDATQDFHDVGAAMEAGYASLGSCVSGPERGAMGIHFGNGAFIEDGLVDVARPELLIYEQRDGDLHLLGVEHLVIAATWDAAHPGAPPVLLGQHFQFVNSPNRYGLPAFYELHVWAWKDNPFGAFVDWNPKVSCEEYTGEPSASHAGH